MALRRGNEGPIAGRQIANFSLDFGSIADGKTKTVNSAAIAGLLVGEAVLVAPTVALTTGLALVSAIVVSLGGSNVGIAVTLINTSGGALTQNGLTLNAIALDPAGIGT